MARSQREERSIDAVRVELRREDDVVDRDEPTAGDPERPDVPLGVPAGADTDERPGFPRDDPSQG